MNENYLRILESENINCSHTEEVISDLIDGELATSLEFRIRAHIEDCDFCKEFEAEYRMVIELAKQLKAPPMPPGVSERLKVRLNVSLGLNL